MSKSETKAIYIRPSADLRAAIEERAAQTGLSPNAWVKWVVEKELEKEVSSVGSDEIMVALREIAEPLNEIRDILKEKK